MAKESKDTLTEIKKTIIKSNKEIVAYGENFMKFDNSKKLKKRGLDYEDLLKLTEEN